MLHHDQRGCLLRLDGLDRRLEWRRAPPSRGLFVVLGGRHCHCLMRMHAVLEGPAGAWAVRARGEARRAAPAPAAEAADEEEQGDHGSRGADGDNDPGAEAEDGGALREPGARHIDAQHGRRALLLVLLLPMEMVARRRRRTRLAARWGASRHGSRRGRR
uniref:Uncharacterized protein n=1 Tax=Arundo donax TaxID=35708 RepID=A0A0A9DXF8_ARUDO